MLALTDAADGDSVRAREILDELEAAPGDRLWAGLVRAGLGDPDGALEAFDRIGACSVREIRSLRYLFPEALGPVRGDPRYEALLGDVNRHLGLEPDGSVPDSTVEAFGSVTSG